MTDPVNFTITDPALVPDEFCLYSGSIPVQIWEGVKAFLEERDAQT
jgi:hypothetical protein